MKSVNRAGGVEEVTVTQHWGNA